VTFQVPFKVIAFSTWNDTEHATLTKINTAQMFRNEIEQNNLSLLLNIMSRNSLLWELNARGVAKYSDFGPRKLHLGNGARYEVSYY